MGTLSISETVFSKFFDYLKNFDKTTKNKLITVLKESVESDEKKHNSTTSLFGMWNDDKTSDEIIKEIQTSRIEKQEPTFFDEISSRH